MDMKQESKRRIRALLDEEHVHGIPSPLPLRLLSLPPMVASILLVIPENSLVMLSGLALYPSWGQLRDVLVGLVRDSWWGARMIANEARAAWTGKHRLLGS